MALKDDWKKLGKDFKEIGADLKESKIEGKTLNPWASISEKPL